MDVFAPYGWGNSNVFLKTKGGVCIETAPGTLSCRQLPFTFEETAYAGKSIAIDFKPEADGNFELTYMSSPDYYVGDPDLITVTGGVQTATFGTITAGDDGWFTLTVADAQLCASGRTEVSSTIAYIYLARFDAATCSRFIVDYYSVRVVA